MVVSALPVTDNASQLLDRQRESFARFEAVPLTQRLVTVRKLLSLVIEVPLDLRRRRPRKTTRKEKDRQRKREKKRLKKASPHTTAQPSLTLAQLLDSPLG